MNARSLVYRVALLLFALAALAGVVQKNGRLLLTDVTLSEGFEDNEWRLSWTVVDADSSGSSWERLSESEDYIAATPEGSHALGCRYNSDRSANDDWLITPPLLTPLPNEDGSSPTCRMSIKLCSQDVNYLESAEILRLRVDEPLSGEELRASLDQFQLREEMSPVLASWETWTEDIPVQDTQQIYYYAIRCVSQDEFILLVDQVVGTNLTIVASGSYFRESRYELTAFGAVPTDSYLVSSVELWNLSEDQIRIQLGYTPYEYGAFWIENSGTQLFEDDLISILSGRSVELDVNLLGSFSIDDQEYNNLGVQLDSLIYGIVEPAIVDLRDTSFVPDWLSLVDTLTSTDTSMTVGVIYNYDRLRFSAFTWSMEDSGTYSWYQDCEADTAESELAGWEQRSLSETGWQLGEYVSSINFTVPYHSQFFFINSDAQGRWDEQGNAIEQSDTLMAPMTALSAGSSDNALYFGYSLYYAEGYGSSVEVLGRGSSSADWTLLDLPEASELWECRSTSLAAFAGSDSIQVALVYHGQWSYGVAVDDLVLLQGDAPLPGSAAPQPVPDREPEIEVSIYPNPFNPTAVVSYQAPATGALQMSVYNLRGQLVFREQERYVRSGLNQFPLNLDAQAAGMYFVRFELKPASGVGASTQIRKVTLLR